MLRLARRPPTSRSSTVARTDVGKLGARKEHLGLAGQIQGEELGKGHRYAVEHLLERGDGRAHAVLFDERYQPIGHAGTLGELALREPVHLPDGLEMRTYIDAHTVHYIKHFLRLRGQN